MSTGTSILHQLRINVVWIKCMFLLKLPDCFIKVVNLYFIDIIFVKYYHLGKTFVLLFSFVVQLNLKKYILSSYTYNLLSCLSL